MTGTFLCVIVLTSIVSKTTFDKWLEDYKKHSIAILFLCILIDYFMYFNFIKLWLRQ